MKRKLRSVAILIGTAVIGALVGVGSVFQSRKADDPSATSYADPMRGCRVTDGDTIRCGDERIRLLGIDAPELPGHCRKGRHCAPGDPYASTASLNEAMTGSLTIKRVGTDHYGRTLALVAGAKGDLSCWQLEKGQAIYRNDWDNGLRVARACPASVF